jgi:glutamate/tyrosine decarboxylase-like PLP-dependent enzyme
VAGERHLLAHGSRFVHAWIEKAADMSGIGTKAIRWIEADASWRIDPPASRARARQDVEWAGLPVLITGATGATEIGAIDPLRDLAAIAREVGCWFPVDAADGDTAVGLPEAPDELAGLPAADSVPLIRLMIGAVVPPER